MHSSSDTKRQGVYRHMLTTLISIITYPTRLQNSCISSRLSYRTSPAGNGSLQPTLGSRPVLRGSPESSLPPKRAPDGLFPAFTTISCRPLLILRVGLAEGCQAAAGGAQRRGRHLYATGSLSCSFPLFGPAPGRRDGSKAIYRILIQSRLRSVARSACTFSF